MPSDMLNITRRDSMENETVQQAFSVVRQLNEWADEHCDGGEIPTAGVTVTAYSIDVFFGDHAAWTDQADSYEELTFSNLLSQYRLAVLDLARPFK